MRFGLHSIDKVETMEDVRLNDILDNWVRWARGRILRARNRVGSLEGNYSTLDWSEQETVPIVAKMTAQGIDILLAERTEGVWRNLPLKLGAILKYEYVAKRYYKLTCRTLKIPFNSYPVHLYDARCLLLKSLDNQKF
jgi:hypothetical protein